MSTSYTASPQAYRESAVLTAPPERLVVMLYDGAGRFLVQAAAAMRNGDVPSAHDRLRRTERIVEHLLGTLDMSQGEISTRLEAIYMFCIRQIAHARMRQDPAALEKVRELLSELRAAWAEAAGDTPTAARVSGPDGVQAVVASA